MQIGFAWYTRETWERLRELADDREPLDDSFAKWARQATNAVRELEASGDRVRKGTIDVETAAAWCRERGRRFDSARRKIGANPIKAAGNADRARVVAGLAV